MTKQTVVNKPKSIKSIKMKTIAIKSIKMKTTAINMYWYNIRATYIKNNINNKDFKEIMDGLSSLFVNEIDRIVNNNTKYGKLINKKTLIDQFQKDISKRNFTLSIEEIYDDTHVFVLVFDNDV